MFNTDALEALALERGQRLRAEAEAERMACAPSRGRRTLAAFLRSAADRLDPAALTRPVPPGIEANR
jgi:hypothetical protein